MCFKIYDYAYFFVCTQDGQGSEVPVDESEDELEGDKSPADPSQATSRMITPGVDVFGTQPVVAPTQLTPGRPPVPRELPFLGNDGDRVSLEAACRFLAF